MPQNVTCQIRWARRREIDAILAVEQQCFDEPKSRAKIESEFDADRLITVVVIVENAIVGWCQYVVSLHAVYLAHLAVAPQFWRQGIATAVLSGLKRKLRGKRTKVVVYVPEEAIAMQQTLRANGFLCESLIQDLKDTGLLEFKWHRKCQGAEIIERILAGDVRVMA